MLAKIQHYTSPDQIKSIYYAIFGSHMTYGCQIWGQSYSRIHVNKIQTLQNNGLRIISFAEDYRDHVTPLYINNNLLQIKDLIELKNILHIHDYFHGKLPDSFDGYFTLRNDIENLDIDSIQSRSVKPTDR